MEADVVPFDREFVVRGVIEDETYTEKELEAGEQVENFRSLHACFLQFCDALSDGSGFYDN
jgi:hypothetical protein